MSSQFVHYDDEQLREFAVTGGLSTGTKGRIVEELRWRVNHPNDWEFVVHGEMGPYRAAVVGKLAERERYEQAIRFALCGRGDRMEARKGMTEFRVRPQFCGNRACPRCSRLGGTRMVFRTEAMLASKPHGAIWHVVLTQQARARESLKEARARFEKKWVALAGKGTAKLGVVGGLMSYHLKLRDDRSWHYHAHLCIETASDDGGVVCQDIIAKWRRLVEAECDWSEPMFWRLVCGPGAAFDFGNSEEQLDFFEEAKSEAAKLLQYVLRDVVTGVEKWVGTCAAGRVLDEFLEGLHGAKLHRLLGEWRKWKPAKETEDVKAPASGETEEEWEFVGFMGVVVAGAARGVVLFVNALRVWSGRLNGRSAAWQRFQRVASVH